jgi:hypothetical protein
MRTRVAIFGIVAAVFFVVAAVLTLSTDVSDRDIARFVLFGLASATFAWTLDSLDRR